jgi:hypothetical protein
MKKILLSLIFLFTIVQIFAQPLRPNVRQAQLNFPKSFIVWETLKPTITYNPVMPVAKSDNMTKPNKPANKVNKSSPILKSVRPQIKTDTLNNVVLNNFIVTNKDSLQMEPNRLYGNNRLSKIDSTKYLDILYGNCKPDISLDKSIGNNITVINNVSVMFPKDSTNTKPKLTSLQIKGYKNDKVWGWVNIGSGVIIQGVAVWTFVKCYEPIKNRNSITIIDSKINVKQSRSSNVDNVKLGLITGGMALVGLGLEIAGGIQIHKANVGLGRITYNF